MRPGTWKLFLRPCDVILQGQTVPPLDEVLLISSGGGAGAIALKMVDIHMDLTGVGAAQVSAGAFSILLSSRRLKR